MWTIAGSGVAGSYLYGRLKNGGFEVRIFDPKVENFYIPCGFATNENLIKPFLDNLNIGFDQICEASGTPVEIVGNNFEPTEARNFGLCTINKMKMEQLMVGDSVIHSKCPGPTDDPVVDATGISRFYLPPAVGDKKMYAMEKVCSTSDHENFYFYFFPKGRGYFWSFPLKGGYHIGAGGIDLEEVRSYLNKYESERILSRKIRMKPIMKDITSRNVIGVGESIGYISPLLGEGIVPALESAEALFQCIAKTDDLIEISELYLLKIRKRMDEFNRISGLVENMQSEKAIALSNILSARLALNEMKKFGFGISFRKILSHFL